METLQVLAAQAADAPAYAGSLVPGATYPMLWQVMPPWQAKKCDRPITGESTRLWHSLTLTSGRKVELEFELYGYELQPKPCGKVYSALVVQLKRYRTTEGVLSYEHTAELAGYNMETVRACLAKLARAGYTASAQLPGTTVRQYIQEPVLLEYAMDVEPGLFYAALGRYMGTYLVSQGWAQVPAAGYGQAYITEAEQRQWEKAVQWAVDNGLWGEDDGEVW